MNQRRPISRRGFNVVVTGPHDLERAVSFSIDEEPEAITAHLQVGLDE